MCACPCNSHGPCSVGKKLACPVCPLLSRGQPCLVAKPVSSVRGAAVVAARAGTRKGSAPASACVGSVQRMDGVDRFTQPTDAPPSAKAACCLRWGRGGVEGGGGHGPLGCRAPRASCCDDVVVRVTEGGPGASVAVPRAFAEAGRHVQPGLQSPAPVSSARPRLPGGCFVSGLTFGGLTLTTIGSAGCSCR